jgi:hypothetical protein
MVIVPEYAPAFKVVRAVGFGVGFAAAAVPAACDKMIHESRMRRGRIRFMRRSSEEKNIIFETADVVLTHTPPNIQAFPEGTPGQAGSVCRGQPFYSNVRDGGGQAGVRYPPRPTDGRREEHPRADKGR